MKVFKLTKFKKFYYVNFFAIAFLEIFFILFLNKTNRIDSDTLKIICVMILISGVIIVIQYPLLILFKNWIYKSIIYYLSMLLFLFVLGIVFHITEFVNCRTEDLVESGLKMIVMGQIFGGLLMYIILIILNWKLRDDIF